MLEALLFLPLGAGLIMLLVVLARPDGLLSLIGGIYQKFLARFTPAVATDQEKEAERVC